MSSIGPQIPAHFQNRPISDEEGDVDADIGPQIPPELVQQSPPQDEDDDDDDYGPALPPDMIAARSAGPSVSRASAPTSSASKRVVGPSFPSYPPIYDPRVHSFPHEDDEDEDDFGPKPLPAGVKHAEKDAVTEFMEREERRKKLAEVWFVLYPGKVLFDLMGQEAAKPKALKRDEWMLVPPSSSDLLGGA